MTELNSCRGGQHMKDSPCCSVLIGHLNARVIVCSTRGDKSVATRILLKSTLSTSPRRSFLVRFKDISCHAHGKLVLAQEHLSGDLVF